MAASILESIRRQKNSATVGAAARILGEPVSQVGAAIEVIEPLLLHTLLSAARDADGGRALVDAIADADPQMAANMRVALGSSGRHALLRSGARKLSSLVGEERVGALADGIATYSDLPTDSAHSLLGLMTPFLLSLLAREAGTRGMDARGMVRMIKAQGDQIAEAVPEGLVGLPNASETIDLSPVTTSEREEIPAAETDVAAEREALIEPELTEDAGAESMQRPAVEAVVEPSAETVVEQVSGEAGSEGRETTRSSSLAATSEPRSPERQGADEADALPPVRKSMSLGFLLAVVIAGVLVWVVIS